MGFMQPEVVHQSAWHVETHYGMEIVPAWLVPEEPSAHDLDPFCESDVLRGAAGEPADVEFETGWYARLSAPGYMDRTDWIGPYETEGEALKALADTEYLCEECWEVCWETDTPCEIQR